jgi:predicted esterase
MTTADDTSRLRYALIAAVLARLREEWPALPHWPHAFGGFSGGAKRAAALAAFSMLHGNRPLGVLQLGCNEPSMRYVLEIYQPPKEAFLALPVYLSGGSEDAIAPPDDVDAVERALLRAGFRQVVSRQFRGGHEIHPRHIRDALQWFGEIHRRQSGAR